MESIDAVELVNYLRDVVTGFRSGWFIGAGAVCYALIQLLRGKFGFEIPYVTRFIERLGKEQKTFFILGLFALSGMFAVFGVDGWKAADLLDGLLKGLGLGLGTLGLRNAVKQGIESVSPPAENTNSTPNQ